MRLSTLLGDGSPEPLSSQPPKLRDRATMRSQNKDMLDAPNVSKRHVPLVFPEVAGDIVLVPNAPKDVPQIDTHSEKATKPWLAGIVDYVRHLLG